MLDLPGTDSFLHPLRLDSGTHREEDKKIQKGHKGQGVTPSCTLAVIPNTAAEELTSEAVDANQLWMLPNGS